MGAAMPAKATLAARGIGEGSGASPCLWERGRRAARRPASTAPTASIALPDEQVVGPSATHHLAPCARPLSNQRHSDRSSEVTRATLCTQRSRTISDRLAGRPVVPFWKIRLMRMPPQVAFLQRSTAGPKSRQLQPGASPSRTW